MDKKEIGQLGEQMAEKFLKNKGYTVLGRRLRKRWGEIDLVVRQGKTIVFCEVKTRTTEKFGRGEEAVEPIKQKKMIQTAEDFLAEHADLAECPLRFDVIAVYLEPVSKEWQIEHFENAFGLEGKSEGP
jgi:putative endonuclease